MLGLQNGALAEAIGIWKRNFDKEFEGVEECPICYSVIHTANHSLPRLACKTCKHKFHSACLYKWFSTSHKSTCPLCQSPFWPRHQSLILRFMDHSSLVHLSLFAHKNLMFPNWRGKACIHTWNFLIKRKIKEYWWWDKNSTIYRHGRNCCFPALGSVQWSWRSWNFIYL